jgi:diguanylate cyclase (GGDEF)-like protein
MVHDDDAPRTGNPVGQDSLALMRRVSIIMFTLGGFTCLSGVWMTQSTTESKLAQGVIAGLFIVTGFVLVVVRKPPRWLLEGAILWSVLLLSALIALSDPIGMAPFFYLWPVVFAAYFSSLRVLVVTYAWMVVTLGVGLIQNQVHELKLDTFTGTVATVGLMGALVATMTNQEARLRGELASAAETDPLTGLLNRRSFNPQLDVLVAGAIARERSLTVVMFDLDHFKQLNDDFGHIAGDHALQLVARTLQDQSRDLDLVSRFGGEEFAVALPGADLGAARAYADRVASVLRHPLVETGATLSFSAGICSMTDVGEPADVLLQRADEALYAAKAAGRRRLAWWDGGITVGEPFGDPTLA